MTSADEPAGPSPSGQGGSGHDGTWSDHREALVRAADTALYAAKRAGRHRIAWAHEVTDGG